MMMTVIVTVTMTVTGIVARTPSHPFEVAVFGWLEPGAHAALPVDDTGGGVFEHWWRLYWLGTQNGDVALQQFVFPRRLQQCFQVPEVRPHRWTTMRNPI